MKKILITGANGFIGANLVRSLLENSYDVRILIKGEISHPFLKEKTVEKISGDILDKELVKTAVRNCDYVIHSAAKVSFNKYDYSDLYKANVDGTYNIANAALQSGVEKFVHISACATLGYSRDKDILINEKHSVEIKKANIYAYTKKLAEEKISEFCGKGLNAVIVNPSTVYGAGDEKLNSGSIIKAVYCNKMKISPPGGTTVVAVNDVVNGCILALKNGKAGEKYILSNERMRYFEMLNIIAEVIEAKPIKYKLPGITYYPVSGLVSVMELIFKDRFKQFTSQMVEEIYQYKFFDSSKARKELGWQPETSFRSAVKEAFGYYKEKGLFND